MFHSATTRRDAAGQSEAAAVTSEADSRLQDALIMFPGLLLPLMEKCSVTLDPSVSTHSFFASSEANK